MKTISNIILLFLIASYSFSQTAEDIIRKSEESIKGKTSQGTFIMRVITPNYTRELKMDSWWVGNEKALIVIKSPKKEAGNKTLKIKNEMWIYLKNTQTTIKIPPSMMLQSWNGSDFTNDDLVRESNLIDDYSQKIAGEEILENEKCWKIELIPKPDAPVVWGKLYYWVRQTDYLPAKVDFYDEKGKLMRTLAYSDFKIMGGRKMPAKWTVINRTKEGNRTEFDIIDVKFDIKISDKIFSFQELERGN
ncbi:MAG: outer membrane lipoprotein-sorting protein [Bacteroidetes bacterium]|nr:outer membrane lipoprotein-sorting protein [Bacteroidota bacterium]MBU1422799.1 outer membrane lipoprotein-sorting protein [Bacteroidota bacterium]MBU2472198.1 outer membrane lipoprotein-sorting protein [Bacteroidota bacterium]